MYSFATLFLVVRHIDDKPDKGKGPSTPARFVESVPLAAWGCMFSSMITTSSSSSDRSTASAAVAPLLAAAGTLLGGTAGPATLASLLLGPAAVSDKPLQTETCLTEGFGATCFCFTTPATGTTPKERYCRHA